MNAPAPAAVRAAMKLAIHITQEEAAAYTLDKRLDGQLLTDHIRALAAEMRADADEFAKLAQGSAIELAEFRLRTAEILNRFADKMEGEQ